MRKKTKQMVAGLLALMIAVQGIASHGVCVEASTAADYEYKLNADQTITITDYASDALRVLEIAAGL